MNSGSNQTYSITPADNYKISDVTVDGVSVGAVSSYTFSNVTTNHTIAGTFTPNTYTITATAGCKRRHLTLGFGCCELRVKSDLYHHPG